MPAMGVLILCALGLLGASSARGDSVPVTFTGVNGAAAFGYYVGPYYGTVDGIPVTLYCVDFANEVYKGEVWQANLTLLSNGDLSNTRYGSLPNSLTLYEEAAWLTTQYAQNPSEYADIQATIWRLFVPSAPSLSSNKWLDLAAANFQNVDPHSFTIVTNVGPVRPTGQVQEFLVDPPQVPEPSSIFLFGTAGLLVFVFIRSRPPATG